MGTRVAGIGLDDLPIKRLRLHQVAALMMAEGPGERIRYGRHRNLKHYLFISPRMYSRALSSTRSRNGPCCTAPSSFLSPLRLGGAGVRGLMGSSFLAPSFFLAP